MGTLLAFLVLRALLDPAGRFLIGVAAYSVGGLFLLVAFFPNPIHWNDIDQAGQGLLGLVAYFWGALQVVALLHPEAGGEPRTALQWLLFPAAAVRAWVGW
ncbi:MAG: hypothetical protein EBR82_02845 [Caulobacteraceae bacterium]|nr:hypothetical protein [Caulobacteraceae bacterium]